MVKTKNFIKLISALLFVIMLFYFIILFSSCSSLSSLNFVVGEQMENINEQYEAHIKINALSVYKIQRKYLVIIEEKGVVQNLVEFSSERICRDVQGLCLLKEIDPNQFLNVSFDQAKEAIGEPHVDVGSGFYLPAYVTEDAHIIYFKLDDGIILGVVKRDLFTNEVIFSLNS